MYFIDVQGTLISDSDKSPINGACELIDILNLKNIPYVVITNNTKAKSDDFLEGLRKKGLNIKDGAYLDPFCVLKEALSPSNVAMFGASEFIATMQSLGYVQDLKNPKAVLIASWDDFKFSDFASINELILNGAEFIAMHETSIYKKNGRLYPGVGAIAAMVSYSTGASYKAVGKPSMAFYNEALRLINLQKQGIKFSDITIISDDAKGDLVGAKELGMKTILVLSGKVSDVAKTGVKENIIDQIYKDVQDYIKVINA
ncbi:HAD-IIA family hydrolase [Campylobacter hyointestinalis]|uniref:HAD family hydrolase n=2 Tax=Campylobacter hyointestinalis TaxID=198 RepID=A0A855N879_CAMHY|nr:HAD-IIA family hydrolase [Campylobacter hyointestinalis]ANE33794.1 HAD-superfamily hydrolase, subfamily IIA [Campylobacter hyointestinalis subsp. lawsonii CCUG 27631]KAB0614277.1 HAD-IIA family hydrolase [Campylobacter hyointestinalis subsp. lawsonii]PPB57717.1 HAD family hydrolase [Campylobacter hyointestinalis subsp. hyointestinalis]PPB62553.1 HAD family hydrolase [Campylobacter hyointestinalis subsp. hyointestinalis]PPB71210.1 HAD family hydrolase [Campylobacter hyointestinalis subsp. hy